jgi:hypothetical protein
VLVACCHLDILSKKFIHSILSVSVFLLNNSGLDYTEFSAGIPERDYRSQSSKLSVSVLELSSEVLQLFAGISSYSANSTPFATLVFLSIIFV